MKIIFLDIDGVLNSYEFFMARGPEKSATSIFEHSLKDLNPAQVQLMSNFADEMDASVVISSSWRILHDLKDILSMLTLCGWKDAPIIDITPRISTGFRGSEVEQWLRDYPQDIQDYVIFDDDGDFFPHQPLVQTHWNTGLLSEHLEKARQFLKD